jgi:type 1 glutamine amidotransferase
MQTSQWILALFVLLNTQICFGKQGPSANSSTATATVASAPLKVLLVAGGCCHDYAKQTQILKQGIETRIHSEVTIIFNPSKGTDATFEIYESDRWAEGYDVVIHDECSANVTDGPYVKRILAAHKSGVPAVNLHCAMHSYRWGNFRKAVNLGAENAGWYEMIGLQSTGHGPKLPIDITYEKSTNPIVKGLAPWRTINEELYNNVRVYPGAEVLAAGSQVQKINPKALKANPNAKPKVSKAVVAWTNLYGPKKTKIFSTSLGHFNDTVGDDRYLELVVRGILWTTGNLTEAGKPTKAYAIQP